MSNPVHTRKSGSIAVVTINHPPVNALTVQVRAALLDALTELIRDAAIRGVVIAADGPCFSAGADIAELGGAQAAALAHPDPSDITALIDTADKPVVALLHGYAFGGGLELALGCHHRLATPDTKFGLPEISLGVLPGAGGTQRLPRLIGTKQAAEMLFSGRPINAEQALAFGLIDAIIEGDVIPEAMAYLVALPDARAVRRVRDMKADAAVESITKLGKKAPRASAHAVTAITACLEAVGTLPFDQGMRFEREQFLACSASPQAAALKYGFLAQRRAARLPDLPAGVRERDIKDVGVVGGGTMGRGIAMAVADAGLPVIVLEANKEKSAEAAQAIRNEYQRQHDTGKLSEAEAIARSGRIHATHDSSAVAGLDLVIEAVFEDLAVKREICAKLGRVCATGTIIASNTSTLDIDVLAQASGRPADFLGLHFFSPAHVMRLLEVVRGAATSPDVLATAMSFARRLGKHPVVSGVCYGFIGNRMLEPYLRETEFLLLEGATPGQIDRALEAFGMAMGPCRMLDLAGVDVAAKVVIERDKAGGLPKDPHYRIVCRELFEAGRHGQKNGGGFYRYQGRTPIDDDEVRNLLAALAKRTGVPCRTSISDEEIVERCMLPLMNEGIKVVEEGIAYRPSDVDVVWVSGYGYPAQRGGPMFHAEHTIGLAALHDRLRHYATQRGDRHGYWQAAKSLHSSTMPAER